MVPGAQCSRYSADHLLRQYKRVKEASGSVFTYRNIKQVYTIILQSNTELELLQEYYFIPLDIFKECMENKNIESGLESWLAFLSYDDPVRIEELITGFPGFRAMYQDVYELCLNTEKVMQMEVEQAKESAREAQQREQELRDRVRKLEAQIQKLGIKPD